MSSAGGSASHSPRAAEAPTASTVARGATRGVAALLASSAVINVLQLVSSLVLARALSPTAYGAFAVGSTVVAVGRFLGDCGAGSVVIQEPGRGDDLDVELGRVLVVQSAVTVAAAAVLVLLAPLLTAAFDAPASTTWVVVGLAVALVLEVPAAVPKVRLRRRQQFQRLQVLNVLAVLGLYATQIGGLLLGAGLASLVVAQLVCSALTSALHVGLGGGLVRPVRRGALALARRGLPYQGTLTVQALFGVSSLAVVATQLDTRGLGLYTWCSVLAAPLVALAANLHHVVFPSLARLHEHHGHRSDEAVVTIARLQSLLVGVPVGVLCGLAVPTVRHVFDPAWLDAAQAARAALLGVLPLVLATLLAASVEASGRPRARLQAMAISCSVGVAAALPLSAAAGVTGAAVALYVLVPLVDVVLLLRTARVAVRRAVLDVVLVAGAATGVAAASAPRVEGLPGLLVAAAAASAVGLGVAVLVDRDPLLRCLRLLVHRAGPVGRDEAVPAQ